MSVRQQQEPREALRQEVTCGEGASGGMRERPPSAEGGRLRRGGAEGRSREQRHAPSGNHPGLYWALPEEEPPKSKSAGTLRSKAEHSTAEQIRY